MEKVSKLQFEARIERVSWSASSVICSAIRKRVFVDEQGIPESVELDNLDETASHYLAIVEKKPVATARLLADGRVGRIAVLSAYRNASIGSQLLEFIKHDAQKQGLPKLYLHSQADSINFYVRRGFTAMGETFEEAGKLHQAMELMLDYRQFDDHIISAHYPEPAAQLILNLCERAERRVKVFSDTLDHALFDNKELAECLSCLARGKRESLVQLLITDSKPIQIKGHRLLDLARKLPSSVQLHTTRVPEALSGKLLVIADHYGVAYMHNANHPKLRFEPDDRPLCTRMNDAFERVWQRSERDPNLRILDI